MISVEQICRITALAWTIRRRILEMIGVGNAGHLGGSFSAAEIVAALYGYKLRHDPARPHWPERDRFVMSKGHAALAQYAALAEFGYFPPAELARVKCLGAMLQGHPDLRSTPGVEANTGSLGQGLSLAVGMALGLRLDGNGRRVYCLVGDGEIAEGQIWEAAMAASNFRLDNLTAIIDYNGIQATGPVARRFDTNPLPPKWRAFGWQVLEIDGHDVAAVCAALDEASLVREGPCAIIAQTVKGKGVAFAENTADFHNAILNEEQYRLAVSLVEAQRREDACRI